MRPHKSQAQACSVQVSSANLKQVFQSSVRKEQQQGHTSQGEDKYMGAHMRLQEQVVTEMKNPERRSRSGVYSIPIPALQKIFLTFRKSSCTKSIQPVR